MSFRCDNKKLLKIYKNLYKNISSKIKINDNAYIKSKIDEMRTHIHGNKVPKEKISYKCLSLIRLESILRTNESKYHPQI